MNARPVALLPPLALLTLACGSQPVGLSAQIGSSFALALTNEVTEGALLGYGATYGGSTLYDDQRGHLRVVLKRVSDGAEFDLTTRLITRVFPDPASYAGLANEVDTGWQYGISQPVAVVDIPTDQGITPGTYDILTKMRRRTSPSTWTEVAGPAAVARSVKVLPADVSGTIGTPTPLQGFLAGVSQPNTAPWMPQTYPYPKVVVGLGSPPPAAAHLVVNYPGEKMAIYGVIEEQHTGRYSIVAFQDDPQAEQLTIDFVDPDASVKQLAIVFELLDPFGAGRVSVTPPPGDLTLNASETKLYDANGALLPTNVSFGPIR
jgi:hypothetical protein